MSGVTATRHNNIEDPNIAKANSPEGGLWGIRLKNGWDDSLPPVLGPDFLPKMRTGKYANKTEEKAD